MRAYRLHSVFLKTSLVLMLLCAGFRSQASHIYGADFYYTWVSGNIYKVTLAMYGDCSGASFPYLDGASPQVEIYNSGSLYTTINLVQEGPGVEVTPVCPDDAGNTVCSNPSSTIPGVKRYIYSSTVNLLTTSTSWLFRFNGFMGSGFASAGRSGSITNIVYVTSGAAMALEAQLNNVVANNSSPTFTTIPTPFFCINVPTGYNPGAVDPNGDSLAFSLVPGMTNIAIGTTVTYVSPYTATDPLSTVAGTFSFSTVNGQMSFTPDITQKALVVNQVNEYVGTTLVGTAMREMTFVVLPSCDNTPPSATLTGASGGTTISDYVIRVCRSEGLFTCHFTPSDPDGDNITVTWAGLPAGATMTVTGNGTPSPNATLSWDVTSAVVGNHIFYLTYTDDGCPLTSKQTIAYTIKVVANPKLTYNLVSAATCTKKAVFTITPSIAPSPWTVREYSGSTLVHTLSVFTGSVTDSLDPGTYTIEVENAYGCTHDTSITIAAPPLPHGTVNFVLPSCPGTSDGSITVAGFGGASPYTYALGTGTFGSSGSFTGLAAGTYMLHIKDANNCVKDTSVVLPGQSPIHATISRKKPTCNATSDGQITATGFGSTSPYTYAIGSGTYSSTNIFTSLAAGSYVIHVKNSLGCVMDTTVTLTDSLKVKANIPITNVSCNGAGDGSITLNGFGSISPYTYALGSGSFSSTNTFGSLTPASYTFHVHDALGCYLDTTLSITQPPVLTGTISHTNVSCNGGSNGTITVTSAGGTAPYTYSLNGGAYASASTFSSLSSGNDTVYIKDAHGCLKMLTAVITQPAVLTFSLSLTSPNCNGSADGSIVVSAAGGTTPYSYAINTGTFGSSSTLSGLVAGSQVVHLKDANGCIKDSTVTLTEPLAITVSASVKKSTCDALDDGKVILTAGGGSPSYTYAKGTGTYGGSSTFTLLAAGTYTFHVKDSHGCIKDTAITITDSLAVHSTATVTNAACNNELSGSFTLAPFGASAPYTYAVGTGSFGSSPTFSSLGAGTYTVHIHDVNGCTKDTSITIAEPTAIVPAVAVVPPACYGQTNGSITITAGGGTPGYTYALGSSSYQASSLFDSLGANNYVMFVQDANGCIHDTIVSVTQPASLVVTNLTGSNVLCYGGISGSATVTLTGGTPAYNYSADAGTLQLSNTLGGLNAGLHLIHVEDANGCTVDTSLTLTEPPSLYFASAFITNPTCEGFTDGGVVLFGGGGTPVYTYSADNTTFAASSSFSNMAEGSYTFYMADNNGCRYDTTVTLTGYPHILYDNIGISAVSCWRYSDGSLTVAGIGGNPPLSYQLVNAPLAGAGPSFDSLISQQYVIRITDVTGCIKDSSVLLPTPDSLYATMNIVSNDCIGMDDNGIIEAETFGGTGPYEYAWSTGVVSDSAILDHLANGLFSVVITDAHNCVAIGAATVRYDDCCKPFIPDAFTPNNDGRNDEFHIRYKGDMRLEEFAIYNRFGQKVWTTTNETDGWDGTFGGQPCELGTYYYYARIICGWMGDHHVELKGDVTLIR